MDLFYSLLAGACLSAATGFRIFMPYLLITVYAGSGISGHELFPAWPDGNTSLIIFGFAAIVEIAGYYNPWMCNMLDLITSPLSIISGLILMNLSIPEMNGALRWLIVILAGGGIGACSKLLNVRARLHTSIIKNGRGDAVFATIEFIFAVLISFFALYNPVISLVVIIIYAVPVLKILNVIDRQGKVV